MKITCTEKEREKLMIEFNKPGYECHLSGKTCDKYKSCEECLNNEIVWDIIPEPVDWLKAEVDTPVMVSLDNSRWHNSGPLGRIRRKQREMQRRK